ncbi:MAG TPA: Clp protease N-terminal domain-containing protein, partial [Ktedonobacterales bacterium]|nr:Clp protease N-terminal domain-containing protein [Ktedonobacterales bacterium]
MNRFDRYNAAARKALTQARESALRLNHKMICTEHLLYGLIDEREGVIAMIFSGLGISASKVQQALDFVIGKN